MPAPTLYPLDTTVPAANNDPADDQPEMLTNFGNINGVIAVDHVTPGNVNNGYHNQATLVVQAVLPTTYVSNSNVFYCKSAGNTPANELFCSPGTSTNEYQLTSTSTSQYSTFGNNTLYTANHNGGWSFIPGAAGSGLIIQYGKRSTSATTLTVTFPRPFKDASSVYSVIATPQSATQKEISIQNITATNFVVNTDVAANFINWVAIGVPA